MTTLNTDEALKRWYAASTVEAFATALHMPVEDLLLHLCQAGIDKASKTDPLSDQDKDLLVRRLHTQLAKTSQTKKGRAVSVNKVLLIERLGSEETEGAFSNMYTPCIHELLLRKACCGFSSVPPDDPIQNRNQEVRRRLAQTLRALCMKSPSLQHTTCRPPSRSKAIEPHGGAFFHTLKLDERNRP